ncbi:MAG: hypothetical protein AAFQ62_10605 [Pseudomonadota bacterium]
MVNRDAGDKAFPRGLVLSYPDGLTVFIDCECEPLPGQDALFSDGTSDLFGRVRQDGTLRPLDDSWSHTVRDLRSVGAVVSVAMGIRASSG